MKNQHYSVEEVKIESIREESLAPSVEFAESPLMKKRTFETLDFPTEETIHLRSLNSPGTADSSLPLSRDTFYGKVKDSIWGNRLHEKLRFLKENKERSQFTNDSKTKDKNSRNSPTPDLIKIEEFEARNIQSEPYELVTVGDENAEKIPTLMWCAYCKGEMRTQVGYVNSAKTFWAAVGIFLAGGVLGCFMCPYMTNQCKAPRVTCSRCQRILH